MPELGYTGKPFEEMSDRELADQVKQLGDILDETAMGEKQMCYEAEYRLRSRGELAYVVTSKRKGGKARFDKSLLELPESYGQAIPPNVFGSFTVFPMKAYAEKALALLPDDTREFWEVRPILMRFAPPEQGEG